MTKNERVLELLERHGRNGLTALEAMHLGCGMRLGARIFELREQGHDIEADFVTVQTATGSARVARYRLKAPTVAAPMSGSQESWI